MNDQATALRSLVDQRQYRVITGHADELAEVWAFASGGPGIGLRTIVESVRQTIEQMGRSVQVWDYRRVSFHDDLESIQQGEIALAVLANQPASRNIWQAADRTFLVSDLETQTVIATYAQLERLGAPERAGEVGLILNRIGPTDDVTRLQRNFDQSTQRFLQTRTLLAGVVPRVRHASSSTPHEDLFAAESAAARAIRSLVNITLQRPIVRDVGSVPTRRDEETSAAIAAKAHSRRCQPADC